MFEYNVLIFPPFFLAIPFSSNMSFSIPNIGDNYVMPLASYLEGRDWLKPGPNVDYPGQIKRFLLRLHPEWEEVTGEPLEERLKKVKQLKHEGSLLKTYAKATMVALQKELDLDPRYDSEWTWGQCNDELKAKYFDLVERIALAGSIPINRCVGSWMARALMSTVTQHRMGQEKVFFYILIIITID